MNFAEAYFTNLAPDGPNADFLQSYSARLLYKAGDRIDAIYAFRDNIDAPYAKDATLPVMMLPKTFEEAEDTPADLKELYLSFAIGVVNKTSATETNEFMRARERMALYLQAISNARLFKTQEPPTDNVFSDVRSFAKSVLMHQARFPLHPAIVIGFGFNVADALDNPYYGSQHVSWSLTDYQFAYVLAELYEQKTRELILQGASNNDEQEFMDSVKEAILQAQYDIEFDVEDILKAWATDNGFSFAPLTRLYAAFKESPAPLTNSLQVFNQRIQAAYETSLIAQGNF